MSSYVLEQVDAADGFRVVSLGGFVSEVVGMYNCMVLVSASLF